MKKRIVSFGSSLVALFVLGILLVSVQDANAQNTSTTSGVGGGTTVSSISACYAFSSNLRMGDRGQGVDALVRVLIREGLIPNEANSNVSGEDFNEQLASAVVGFQQKYASEILTPNGLSYGTGYVGPSTRAKLNALYGCAPTTTVISVPEPVPNQCYRFYSNLTLGSNGRDVVALQALLKLRGHSTNSDGYFGSVTRSAVMSYQRNNGIPSTGYVGALTRASLNSSCNIPTTAIIPTEVTQTTTVTPVINNSAFNLLPVDGNVVGQATLVGANEDKVLKWNNNGYIHGPDWKWSVNLTNNGTVSKTIKRMVLAHNQYGEGWATDVSSSNPVGKSLYILGTTMSQSCGTSCEVMSIQSDNLARNIPARGSYNFFAYGYPASQTFSGGYLYIEFTDGTSAKINVPASTIRPGGGNTTATCPFSAINGYNVQARNNGENVAVSQTTRVPNGTRSASTNFTCVNGAFVSGPEVANIVCDAGYSSIGTQCVITSTNSSITVLSPNGGTYERGDQLNVRWTNYSGDFDYYRIMLGNTLANSEVQIDDGRQISKYQNSYNSFAVWTFVDRITSTSGVSSEAIKDAYYVKVEAIKNDRVTGGVMNTGKSSIFSIKPNITIQTVGSCTDSDGGRNPNIAGLTDGRVNGIGSYFNDASVASNGGQCSGNTCTSVAEGYCTADGKVSNILTSCTSGYSVNGACVSQVVVPQSPTLSVSLVDANTDKVSGNFSPGFGIRLQSPNANDWHWRATISSVATNKTISSIEINNEDSGQAWSTSDNHYYPLVVLKNGIQLNSQYSQSFDIPAGTTVLDLYGQPEAVDFIGAKATVKFTDGTSIETNVPASSIKQLTVQNQTSAVWDAIKAWSKTQ